jgi:hypothetical protein
MVKDTNQSGHNCNERCPLVLSDFNQIWILKTELSNTPSPPQQYKIDKNPSSGIRVN